MKLHVGFSSNVAEITSSHQHGSLEQFQREVLGRVIPPSIARPLSSIARRNKLEQWMEKSHNLESQHTLSLCSDICLIDEKEGKQAAAAAENLSWSLLASHAPGIAPDLHYKLYARALCFSRTIWWHRRNIKTSTSITSTTS